MSSIRGLPARVWFVVAGLVLIAIAAVIADTLVHDDLSRHRAARPQSQTTTDTTNPFVRLVKPPAPSQQVVHIAWTSTPYDVDHPPAFPGTVGRRAVPWCHAPDLRLATAWTGGGGNIFEQATVTNRSTASCAIQGQPGVAILDSVGRTLVAAQPDPFFVEPWIRLRPGEQASAEVDWLREFCHQPQPRLLRLALPHSGGLLAGAATQAPACTSSTEPASAGRLVLHGFLRRDHERVVPQFTPEAALAASISHVHTRVLQGNALHYRVRLASTARGQIQLDPCLPYRQQLLARATQAVVAEQAFLLNCDPVPPAPDTPASGYRNYYAMRFELPSGLAPGRYVLRWQSALEQVAATAIRMVRVLPVPPRCTQPQLRITARRGGVGLGSFYQPVVFRNISGTTCSLRGYPGVEYAAPDGTALPTSASHRTDIPLRTVVLRPGRAASASLSGSDFGPNGGATPCPPISGVRVIAPGQFTQVLVRGTLFDCNGGQIWVTPVQPGFRPSP